MMPLGPPELPGLTVVTKSADAADGARVEVFVMDEGLTSVTPRTLEL
jgi:hypothetical protein